MPCNNYIGIKQCGRDSYASVFGVEMCSSCITRELSSDTVTEFLRSVLTDPVTAIRSVAEAGVSHFISKTEELSVVPKVLVPNEIPEHRRNGFGKTNGGPEGYQVHVANFGLIGKIVRDNERRVWLVVPTGRKKAVDFAGSVGLATKLLWAYHSSKEGK